MTKGGTVILRISEENKVAIKKAAYEKGQSLSSFITEAALKQVRHIERSPPARGVHGGVPTFFRALCAEAGAGGTNGYAVAGSRLALSLGSTAPYDVALDEWSEEVGHLKELLDRDDDDAVWNWFKRHYPKCMALVPTRRREQFVAGVRREYKEQGIDL